MINPFAVILPSAGSGERFGSSLPKQYHEINGKLVLDYSLELFLSFKECKRVVIAISDSDNFHHNLAKDERVIFVKGGSDRASSVKSSFDSLVSSGFAYDVLIHDSARPCLQQNIVEKFLKAFAVSECSGMIFASPCYETLKLSKDGKEINYTQDRSLIWRAETPQIFNFQSLKDAYDKFKGNLSILTDEAGLFDELENKVLLFKNTSNNLKITLADDLKLAEYLMKETNN